MQDTIEELVIEGVSPEMAVDRFTENGWASASTRVPSEMDLTLYVNGQELVTILCTPVKLNCLVIGFLYASGIISSVKDVTSMRVCEEDALADVRLVNAEYRPPVLRTLTSGCGGGAAFKTEGNRVDSEVIVAPEQVLELMKQLQGHMEIYRAAGGVHASALADTTKLLVVSEDIGRHNTLDKIQGECLLRGLSTKDCLLLSTGRVSSEMVSKAARMQAPIVVSRTSPTERAVRLARDLCITVVGYVRGGRLTVYTHPERLGR